MREVGIYLYYKGYNLFWIPVEPYKVIAKLGRIEQ
jgi:hypothetical protein